MVNMFRRHVELAAFPFRGLVTIAFVSIFFVVAAVMLLSANKVSILLPVLAAVGIFAVFTLVLRFRVGDNLLGEIGFIYISLAIAYTVFPAVTFMLADMDLASGWLWESLSGLLPSSVDLGCHLWRHVLYVISVSIGYLLVRGKSGSQFLLTPFRAEHEDRTILIIFLVTLGCMVTVSLFSAPVAVYWDHYTRFDHLGWFSLRVVYTCLTLKAGGYFVLMTLLFQNFKKYRIIIILLIPSLVFYETAYSQGQRIESLTILLGAVCLYHYNVKHITVRRGALWLLGIAVFFTAIELFRVVDFNVLKVQTTVAQEGIRPASEFGAVYFTSFHLYSERAHGTLPPRTWQLFFNDFISLVPFVDHTQWNPQYWYARYYFPDAIVPPQTLGPIAESAIWGGELDLIIRGLLNGSIFALLMRWFTQRKSIWWAMATYAYLFSTCVMTLKYSVFYQITPFVRILLPSLLFVYFVKRFVRCRWIGLGSHDGSVHRGSI